MKLNKNFISHNDGSEKLVISMDAKRFSGLARGNSTAGFIIECLEKETTEDEIVAKMLKKWDVKEDVARNDVRKIIKQLKSIGAIDE